MLIMKKIKLLLKKEKQQMSFLKEKHMVVKQMLMYVTTFR